MDFITHIGVTNYQNKHLRFGIKESDRGGHIYCIGKTGVGKSTLLLNMAISDIKNGKGVGIIDPHGDISETVLEYIPKERINDVVYFNTTDAENPISFNPLSNVPEEQRYIVASHIVSTLKKVWAESWGPRLEHILRNAVLTLLCYPDANLLDIQPLLTNADFRSLVLQYVRDNALLNFWHKEFNAMTPSFKAEAISPIINKIGLFQTHPLIKNIVNQKKSSFSIVDVMDAKKIFIANLSKGALGEDGTQLLGSLLVTQFQTAALSRANNTIVSRHPFYLYIDEMHSFVTLSFADILSESRKYGLSLFLTHQFCEQLHDDIRAAILGNVGTIICFRIGAADAKLLEEEFAPTFNSYDLINLPKYSIYLKLLIDGTSSQPFSAVTMNLSPITKSYKEEIKNNSRDVYGKKRIEIVNREVKADKEDKPLTLF
ncbi:MAG: type IV secretion system DNA-binding domain-containing protein [Bacteroidota bacterium]|nr:type IV secretion system DNA-binding domain-containing protein [Bacteroidota bacterium]